nr:hypothetical protein [Tanacetum cinerariifolium]
MDKKKKFDLNLEIFKDIFQIFPRVHGQNFDELPTDEVIVSFFKKLGHIGKSSHSLMLLSNRCINLGEILLLSSTEVYLERQPVLTSFVFQELGSFRKTTRKQSSGVVPRDTHVESLSKKKEMVSVNIGKGMELLFKVALTEEAQTKEVLKNRTGAKPEVPDVTEEDSTESEAESWGRDEDDGNNDHESSSAGSDQENDNGDDNTQSDSEKGSDSKQETVENEMGSESNQQENKEEVKDDDEEEDEFVKSTSNYTPTNDEDETNVKSKVNDNAEGDENKRMDDTTNLLYDDVNIRLNKPVHVDEDIPLIDAEIVSPMDVHAHHKNQEGDLATAKKPSKTFDELMSTPIDFSVYIMNGLKITNLTQESLLGPAFKLLKGARNNFAELEYNFEECYKALTEKLDWNNPEGGDYPFDLTKPLLLVKKGNRQIVPVDYFNNDLKYLQGVIATMTYTTSLTKTKAAQYDLPGIEDIVDPYGFEDSLKGGHGGTWFHLTQRFIATCSYSTDSYKDIMKAQVTSTQDGKRSQVDDKRLYLVDDLKKLKITFIRSNRRRIPNIVEFEIRTIAEIVSMTDRTMEELLQAPTEGYGKAIVISEILPKIFDIKTNLLQLVQANKFHGFKKDNPHTHISNFKRMTATLKYRDVLNDAIKLMLFPYSLEGAARIWACPHHGFLKLSQIDTFYNGLTKQDQDSLNAAAGGNLLNKTTREALKIIENKSKVRYSRSKSNVSRVNTNSRDNVSKTDDRIDKLADQISKLVEIVNKQVITPAKAAEKTCVTCEGAHAYYECIATDSNSSSVCAATGSYNQGEMKAVTIRSGLAYEGPSIPTESPLEKVDEQNTEEILDKEHSNSSGITAQVQPPVVPISILELDVSRTQKKPTIPYLSRMEVCHALADLGASINLIPLSIWKKLSLPELTPTRMTLELADRSITHPKGVAEDVFVKVGKIHFPTDFVVVDFEASPRVLLILGMSFLKTGRALIDVYGEEITLRVNDESITFNLNQTMRYSSTYDDTSVNRVDVIDTACEDFVQDVLDFQYNPKSSSPTLSDSCKEPIVKSSSPTLTPFGEKPPELELKELPSHLECAFLEDSNKLLVIIAKNLKVDEREALINVLKSHKQAIAWKISNIKGIDLRFCTHKILMEDVYKPAVQSKRRVNPKIHDVIKKEVIKLLDADMIYPISDSPYIVPTGRVIVSTGRYIVPTGRVIVAAGRYVVPAGSDNDSDNASIHNEAPNHNQQPNIQPQIITTVSNNNAKFPYLKKDEYEVWVMKMEYWIINNDMNIWKVIQNGNIMKRTGRDHDGSVTILPPTTTEEHIAVQRESKARTTLLQSILDDHVADFHYMDDEKDIWNEVKARFSGNAESKKMRKSMLKQEFSEFRIRKKEGLHKGYDRMQKILSQLNQLKAKPDAEDINLKFLRALPSSYTFSSSQSVRSSHSAFVSASSTNKNMSYGDSPNHSSTTTYSVPSYSKTGSHRFGNVIEYVLQSFVVDTEPEQQLTYEDLEHIEKLDLKEMDLKWQMAMLSIRVHKFKQKARRKIDFDKKESARFNK